MIVIACDPGVRGSIAAVHSTDGIVGAERMPLVPKPQGRKSNRIDPARLIQIIAHWLSLYPDADRMGCIEALQSFGGRDSMGGFTAMSMGYAAGVAHGVMVAKVGKVLAVDPKRWKAAYALGKDKHESVDVVRRLYGAQVPTRFAHDKAEAVLIGRWALGEVV